MNTQNPTRSLRRRLGIVICAAFLLTGAAACSSNSGRGIAVDPLKPVKLADLQSQFTARKPLTVDQCKTLAPDFGSLIGKPDATVDGGGTNSYSPTEALCEIVAQTNSAGASIELHIQLPPLTANLQTAAAQNGSASLRVGDQYYLTIQVGADLSRPNPLKIDEVTPKLDAWLQKVADRIDTSGMAG